MKHIGLYKNKAGKTYDLIFYSESKHAYATGPLSQNGVGARGEVASVSAETEEVLEKNYIML